MLLTSIYYLVRNKRIFFIIFCYFYVPLLASRLFDKLTNSQGLVVQHEHYDILDLYPEIIIDPRSWCDNY